MRQITRWLTSTPVHSKQSEDAEYNVNNALRTSKEKNFGISNDKF